MASQAQSARSARMVMFSKFPGPMPTTNTLPKVYLPMLDGNGDGDAAADGFRNQKPLCAQHRRALADAAHACDGCDEAGIRKASRHGGKRLRAEQKRALIAQPDQLHDFLGARIDASRYTPEPLFSLDELLAAQN